MHGNTNDRATGHRLSMYERLSSLGYHIIAFDYRGNILKTFFLFFYYKMFFKGYGDSTGEPSEKNTVEVRNFSLKFSFQIILSVSYFKNVLIE